MPEYRILCTWEVCGKKTIKADSLEEAISAAEDLSPIVMEEKEYIQGSWIVDWEANIDSIS